MNREWNVEGESITGGTGRRSVQSLGLGHRDGRALGVIEAVHSVELHDHVQAVGEHEDHEKTCHQTHPDTRREETCTVAGVRELAAAQVKTLNLWRRSYRQVKLFISLKAHNVSRSMSMCFKIKCISQNMKHLCCERKP